MRNYLIHLFFIVLTGIFLSKGLHAQAPALYLKNIQFTVCGVGVPVSVVGNIESRYTFADGSPMEHWIPTYMLPIGLNDEGLLYLTGNIINNNTNLEFFGFGNKNKTIFRGTTEQLAMGSKVVNFYSIELNNSAGMKLQRQISLGKQFTFTQGNLNLNGNKMDLIPFLDNSINNNVIGDSNDDPELINESQANRIFGTTGLVGFPDIQVLGGALNNLNVGEMGITLTQPMYSGLTEFYRGHYATDVFPASPSINRFFNLTSDNQATDDFEFRFKYMQQHDLAGIPEHKLRFYNAAVNSNGDPTGDWTNLGVSSLDEPNDEATNLEVSPIFDKRHTLFPCDDPEFVMEGFTSDNATRQRDSISACAGDTVTINLANFVVYNPNANFLWSTGETQMSIEIFSPDSLRQFFTVLVTDQKKCFVKDSIEVIWHIPPTVQFVPDRDTVCELDNLLLDPQYSDNDLSTCEYDWDDGRMTDTISIVGLDMFTTVDYSVTITNQFGCHDSDTIKVTHVPNPDVNLGADTVECEGRPVVLDAGDYSSYPYGNAVTYAWFNFRNNVTGNQRTFTVSELGSTRVKATVSAQVASNRVCKGVDEIEVFITDIQMSTVVEHITCFGNNDGSINLTIQDGIPPYQFNWTGPGGFTTTTEDINNLGPGSYMLTVTDDVGCTKVLQPVPTIIEPAPVGFAQVVVVQDSCGMGTGSISLSGMGGRPFAAAPHYDFQWNTGATTPAISSLSSGTYQVTITDSLNCLKDTLITITGPSDILSVSLNTTAITCFGANDGKVNAVAMGGTPPYSYKWSKNFAPFPATADEITNLGPGIYGVTVTDMYNCTASQSLTLTEPLQIQIMQDSIFNVSCNGGSDGRIYITVTSSLPYAVNWSTGAATEDLTGVPAGAYSVTVTYNNNPACFATKSFQLNEPAPLQLGNQVQVIPDWCRNAMGQVSISITGGTQPYTYAWSNGGTGPAITQLTPGTYFLTVTDDHLCTANFSFTVDGPPAALDASLDVDEISCNGTNDGRIRISPFGGNGSYSYSWSGPTQVGNTATGTNLSPGIYIITVTDARQCQKIVTHTLVNPVPIVIQLDRVEDVLCNGGNTGKIFTTIQAPTPFSIEWSNGSMQEDPTGLLAGMHTVTVTFNNNPGCTQTLQVTVNEPSAITSNPQVTNDLCSAGSGQIILNATGGTPPLTFSWNNGANTQDLVNLSAGTYSVTVTDANNCRLTRSFMVTAPATPLTINSTVSQISCNNLTDGQISLQVSGGNGTYSYSWNTGSTQSAISNLGPGTYNVTVTDATGCTGMQSFILTNLAVIQVQADFVKNVSCNGANDGAIQVRATGGGVSQYVVAWSNGANTPTISNLVPGAYGVTVTGNPGCAVSVMFTITEPAALSINLQATDDICYDGGGKIISNPVGGVLPYMFRWSNNATTQDIQGLLPGNYSLTVTDANNCTVSGSIQVNGPQAALTVTSTTSPISCNGANDGSLTVTASGGDGNYTYSWVGGQTSNSISNLAPGQYQVTVMDGNNCTKVETFVLSDPAAIVIQPAIQHISCNGANDGQIDLIITGGGVQQYQVNWSNGANGTSVNNLAPGNYDVTVTGNAGCTETRTFTITEPAQLMLGGNFLNDNCANGTGGIDLQPSGGTPAYSFNWSSGSTSEDLANINAGSYGVTVIDQNGCTQTGNFMVTGSSSPLTLQEQHTDISCNGAMNGSIDVSVTGGTTPYTFNWSNGSVSEDLNNLPVGAYSLTVTDVNNCFTTMMITLAEPAMLMITETVTHTTAIGAMDGAIDMTVTGGISPYQFAWSGGAGTEDLQNLLAGTYDLTVTDQNGCTETRSVLVIDPSVIQVMEVVNNISCTGLNDGSIDLTVSGGVTPYTYTWSDGTMTEDRMGLTPGVYKVTIDDNGGNTTQRLYNISQPNTLNAYASAIPNSCNGGQQGSIDVTVSGGTAPYQFSWSDGVAVEDRMNLPTGTYGLTVTDQNNCMIMISETLSDPPGMNVSFTKMDVTGFGLLNGSIDLTVNGGSQPVRFAWSTGQISEDITGLAAGSYMVTVTDNMGCVKMETIVINQPAMLAVSAMVADISCFGQTDGAIDITAMGGVSPYTYNWSNGSTNEDLTSLNKGNFLLTVTDANNNQVTGSFAVVEPGLLNLQGSVTNVQCSGGSDGMVDLIVNGGTAPFNFSWSDGSTAEDLSAVRAGAYSVTVSDSKNCMALAGPFVITEPAPLTLNIVITNVTAFGLSNGAVDLTVSGGTPPYSYNWSSGQLSEDITNIPAGTYAVTITDVNQICTIVDNIQVTQPPMLEVMLTPTNISCNGMTDGSIDAMITGGVPPYSFAWSHNGQTSEDIANLAAGNYSITVTDNNNHSETAMAQITEPAVLTLQATPMEIKCNGANDGSIDLIVNGGTPPYSYAWSDGSGNEDLSNAGPGTYSVTVTDSRNCIVTSMNYQLNQPSAINISFAKQNVTVNGGSNGSIDITVTGGTPPYMYAWSSGNFSEDLNNIPAGTYTITITDQGNCTEMETIVVDQPQPLTLTWIATNITCNGEGNGSIDLMVQGGTNPYSFNWSTGAISEDIANLGPGNYMVTVMDVNNSTKTATINIMEPALLTLQGMTMNADCNGSSTGGVDLTITGGTAPYNFNWSDGSGNEDLSNAGAGNYSVTVTDANNCTAMASFIITEPAIPLMITFTIMDVTVNGGNDGSIDIAVTGGTPPYSFLWSTGQTFEDLLNIGAGMYEVTVSDANNCMEVIMVDITEPTPLSLAGNVQNVSCNGAGDGSIDLTISGGNSPYQVTWSNGATTEDITGLQTGTYTVTVTDANMQTAQQTYTIMEAMAIQVIGNAMNVSCNGGSDGSIDLIVSGGTTPYSFSWSNGASSEDLNNLPAGIYSVTVTDANSCSSQQSFTINEPVAISITGITKDVSCGGSIDGEINITIAGGTPAYTYAWSSGQISEDVVGLGAGSYIVTVTDRNSCMGTMTFTINASGSPTINATVTDISCNGLNDGTITLALSGGNSPFTYAWSNGGNTAAITGLVQGTFEVTITDANNCTYTGNYMIDEPDALVLNANVQASGCSGANSGSIDLTPQGGTPAYSYQWTGGQLTEDVGNLAPNTYMVTVTDANNCTKTESYQVGSTSQTFEVKFLAPTPIRESQFMQFVDVSFPVPNSWSWSFGDPSSSMSTLPNPTFSYPNDLTKDTSFYTAKLVASTLQCKDTAMKVITVINSPPFTDPELDDRDRNFGSAKIRILNVFPNPADNELYVDIKLNKESYLEITLTDVSGRKLKVLKPGKHLSYVARIETSKLVAGIYFVNVQLNNDYQQTRKIVVQHPW